MTAADRRIKVMHIISGDLWAGAEVQAYTLLKQLRTSCDLHVVLMNSGELADRLTALAIHITILDETRLSGMQILLSLRKLMQKIRPDIIHTHRQKENILGNFANLFSTRAKSVRTSHGAPEFATKGIKRVQVWLDNFAGRYLQQAVIAVSQDLRAKLVALFDASKIQVIPNGVDVAELQSSVGDQIALQSTREEIRIGIVGRLEPVKRVDIFLQMADLLRQQINPYPLTFHIFGDGKLRGQLEAQAKQLDLLSQVTFYGHRKDIASCLASLDVVVMCSDHEGTPMTILEALALGVPVVAHQVGGLTEILHTYPQLLVERQAPDAYAERVASVISDANPVTVSLPSQYFAERNALLTQELYSKLLK